MASIYDENILNLIFEYVYPPQWHVNIMSELLREIHDWRTRFEGVFNEENYFALFFFWSREDYDYDDPGIMNHMDRRYDYLDCEPWD